MKIAIKNTAHIGKAIKLTRLGQGLDQLAAAGLAGSGQSFLSHLENGKDTAQIGKVLEVLASLGIRVELVLPDETVSYIDTHLPDKTDGNHRHTHNAAPTMPALDADTLFTQIAPLYVKRVTR